MENQKSSFPKILIIIAIIVLAAFGGYLLFSKSGMPDNKEVTQDNVTLEGEYSIADIQDRGEPMQCSFALSDGSMRVSGGIVVSDENIRGDFEIEGFPDGTAVSHFIVKDGISYTWTSLANVGYKAPVSKNPNELIGIEDKLNYTCRAWAGDLSQFNLPSGINFLDLPQ